MNRCHILLLAAAFSCKGDLAEPESAQEPVDNQAKLEQVIEQRIASKTAALPAKIPPKATKPEDLPLASAAALSQAEKDCEGGNVVACVRAGDSHSLGDFGAPDGAKTFALYGKACQLGHLDACGANAMGLALGQGVKMDRKAAEELATTTCEAKGAEGCHVLGYLTETGTSKAGVKNEKATGLYQQACDLKSMDACHELSMVFLAGRCGMAKDIDKAIELTKQACELGRQRSCYQIGILQKRKLEAAAKAQ